MIYSAILQLTVTVVRIAPQLAQRSSPYFNVLSKAKSPMAWQSKAIIWIIAEKQGDRRKCQLEISCITCRAGESTIDLHSVLRR